ncbi:VOC family protein [Schlesneria paludicola]|uniref:VOC family protein n=1 Tax=Schlesneria paludicola TaxID=360056 RepID=UPI00029A5F75|nr:VOC family protein [Schlesneria paludicola]
MSGAIQSAVPLLQVFDILKSIAFYRDVLEFAVVSTSDPAKPLFWAMLQNGGATLMLNSAFEEHERPAQPDAGRSIAHADTTLFLNCEDVDAFYELLCDKHWPVEPPQTTSYGMRQVYARDPDQFCLCFQQPVDQPEGL